MVQTIVMLNIKCLSSMDSMQIVTNSFSVCLKEVVSKDLQKPYICGRGLYNSWGDDAYHVDTLGANPQLGATDDHGGYHWSGCHTPLGHILQVFMNRYTGPVIVQLDDPTGIIQFDFTKAFVSVLSYLEKQLVWANNNRCPGPTTSQIL